MYVFVLLTSLLVEYRPVLRLNRIIAYHIIISPLRGVPFGEERIFLYQVGLNTLDFHNFQPFQHPQNEKKPI